MFPVYPCVCLGPVLVFSLSYRSTCVGSGYTDTRRKRKGSVVCFIPVYPRVLGFSAWFFPSPIDLPVCGQDISIPGGENGKVLEEPIYPCVLGFSACYFPYRSTYPCVVRIYRYQEKVKGVGWGPCCVSYRSTRVCARVQCSFFAYRSTRVWSGYIGTRRKGKDIGRNQCCVSVLSTRMCWGSVLV